MRDPFAAQVQSCLDLNALGGNREGRLFFLILTVTWLLLLLTCWNYNKLLFAEGLFYLAFVSQGILEIEALL